MSEQVGEISYDKDAELVYGANYPGVTLDTDYDYKAELLLIDRDKGASGSDISIYDQIGRS